MPKIFERYDVYGLVDTRDNSIFYVGISGNIKGRASNPSSYAGNHGVMGVFEALAAMGLKHEVKILEKTTADDRHIKERYWIYKLHREGHKLQNVNHSPNDEGGTASVGTSWVSFETRLAIKDAMIKHGMSKSEAVRYFIELGVEKYKSQGESYDRTQKETS